MADVPSYHTSAVDAAKITNEAGVKLLVLYHLLPPWELESPGRTGKIGPTNSEPPYGQFAGSTLKILAHSHIPCA